MKKTIGTYTIKMDPNSNLITVTNNGEMIYGKAVKAADSGSAYKSIYDKVQVKVSKDNVANSDYSAYAQYM